MTGVVVFLLFLTASWWTVGISNGYSMVCPPVRGDTPRALASGLSPVQAGKSWYNYFIPPSGLAQYEFFWAHIAFGKCKYSSLIFFYFFFVDFSRPLMKPKGESA